LSKPYRLAVVGATGLVGEALIGVLRARDFPVAELHALASARSVGSSVAFGEEDLPVAALDEFDFARVDFAFFAAGERVATEYAPRAAAAGAIVIDSSAAFRSDPAVPLVVAELNPEALADYAQERIIACPSAEGMALGLALAPLDAAAGLERVTVAAYTSASAAGRAGIEALAEQCRMLLNARPGASEGPFPGRMAFNCIPEVGALQSDGYSTAEAQTSADLRRLLGLSGLPVGVTAVWVPAFFGLGLAVEVVTGRAMSAEEARALLAGTPGLGLPDRAAGYATPAVEATGQDLVYVGRLRGGEGPGSGGSLAFWLAVDNVHKAGATNSVRAVEILVRDYF